MSYAFVWEMLAATPNHGIEEKNEWYGIEIGKQTKKELANRTE